jgi:hypothetical protein
MPAAISNRDKLRSLVSLLGGMMIIVAFLLYSFVTALISAVDPHVDASMILESAQAGDDGREERLLALAKANERSNAERRQRKRRIKGTPPPPRPFLSQSKITRSCNAAILCERKANE